MFCFKTVILPTVQQMAFFSVSGYQVLPFVSLAGLLPGGSLLPVCYGNILVNDSS